MPSNDRVAARLRMACAPALACLCLLAACSAPQPPTVSVVELSRRPAEHALLEGMRKYEDGAFDQAEGSFKIALHEGLADRRDRAVAYKYLAFIDCAFARLDECEANFRSAFASDPGFRLTDAEIGHPIWGPVYQRVAAAQTTGAR